jgi:hypothetical protein
MNAADCLNPFGPFSLRIEWMPKAMTSVEVSGDQYWTRGPYSFSFSIWLLRIRLPLR